MSLNSYKLEKIGEDGYCVTYLATSKLTPTKDYCIVKQFPVPDESALRSLMEKFKPEAWAWEELSKQSNGMIPTINDYFVEDGNFFLVQEYVAGPTLLELVTKKGQFTESHVRQILIDILRVLIYIHKREIIHKDIRPSNIILRKSYGEPVLINFDVLKGILNSSTSIRNVKKDYDSVGVSEFMPFEQVSGHPKFVSDIYSLGLTAIFALTGIEPNKMKTHSKIGKINWQKYAPHVSTNLLTILDKSVQPDPDDRWYDAKNMLDALLSEPSGNLVAHSDMRLMLNPEFMYSAKETRIRQSQFWDKADRTAVMIAGGIALGSAIFQVPGAIIGGMLAAGYAWYIRLS
jgi:serine/threonine protein kinase, bacterial